MQRGAAVVAGLERRVDVPHASPGARRSSTSAGGPVATERPPDITTTVSATAAASARSCDDEQHAEALVGEPAQQLRHRRRSRRGRGARSARRRSGPAPPGRAPTAIWTRWSSPPESVRQLAVGEAARRRRAPSPARPRRGRRASAAAAGRRAARGRSAPPRARHAVGHARALRHERPHAREPAAAQLARRPRPLQLHAAGGQSSAARRRRARASTCPRRWGRRPRRARPASSAQVGAVEDRRAADRRRCTSLRLEQRSDVTTARPQQPEEQRHAEHAPSAGRPAARAAPRTRARERVAGQQQRRAGQRRDRDHVGVADGAAAPAARRAGRRGRGSRAARRARRRRRPAAPRRSRRRAGSARGRAPSEAATSSPSASRSSGRDQARPPARSRRAKYGQTTSSVRQPFVVSPPARKKTPTARGRGRRSSATSCRR